jgi:hypothetical protein
MSKSARTQRRYAKANRNQTALTQFTFATTVAGPSSNPRLHRRTTPSSEVDPTGEVQPVIPRRRSSTVLSDPVTLENETLRSDAESAGDGGNPEMDAGDNKSHFTADVDNAEMQAEDWEDELEEAVHGPIGQVKGWDELRKQIKADLKKNSKTLPLSRLNQLFILSSFATLRLKGVSWITASQEIA